MKLSSLLHESMLSPEKRGLVIAGCVLFVASGFLVALWAATPRHQARVEAPTIAKDAPDAFANIQVSAKAAVVYDLTTGEKLYGKNEFAQLPLASVTKLLSIYAASESLSENSPITISKSALSMDGDSGLTEGDVFRFSDLGRLALVASSNDAAEAIAETSASRRGIGRTELLQQAAAAAGLSQTYAINGTGLDEGERVAGAYGSAQDIAILAGDILEKSPLLARATIEPTVKVTSFSGKKISAHNTNPDVPSVPGLLLSKTGYTDLAGGNLVIVFDAGVGHPVAITVLGSTREARFSDTSTLLSATLAHFAGLTPSP